VDVIYDSAVRLRGQLAPARDDGRVFAAWECGGREAYERVQAAVADPASRQGERCGKDCRRFLPKGTRYS
jgi:hypothetical protein